MAMASDCNEAKLRELILYVANRCAYDETLGATKLNKILFYVDFTSYAERGEAVTGAKYRHQRRGPTLQRMESVRAEMVGRGDVIEQEVPYYGRTQKRLVAQRAVRPEHLNEDDIAIVERVLSDLDDLNAAEVSDLSHGTLAWRLTNPGETIPYEAALLPDEKIPLTPRQREIGQEVLDRLWTEAESP